MVIDVLVKVQVAVLSKLVNEVHFAEAIVGIVSSEGNLMLI